MSILREQVRQLLLAWDREILSSFAILNDTLDVWKCLSCHTGVVGFAQLEARDAASRSMLPKTAPFPSPHRARNI